MLTTATRYAIEPVLALTPPNWPPPFYSLFLEHMADISKGNSNQEVLERCNHTNITEYQYRKYIDHVEKYGRDLGVNKMMDEYNLNIIIGPLECDLGNFAASAGKFVAHACNRARYRDPGLFNF